MYIIKDEIVLIHEIKIGNSKLELSKEALGSKSFKLSRPCFSDFYAHAEASQLSI